MAHLAHPAKLTFAVTIISAINIILIDKCRKTNDQLSILDLSNVLL